MNLLLNLSLGLCFSIKKWDVLFCLTDARDTIIPALCREVFFNASSMSRARAEKVRRGGVEQEISLALRTASSALVFNLTFSNYPGASQPKVNLAEANYTE